MNKIRFFLLVTALSLLALSLFAANDVATHSVTMNVNEVVLVDLNDATTIVLSTIAPANGGELPTGSTDSTKLLQYTSLVASGLTRTLTVQWGGADAAPAGTSLKLEATSVPAGCGTAAAQVTISPTGQSLITGIGSCATGTGASGAALDFTFSIDDVNSLVVGESKTVTLTYTLTDAT